MKKGWLCLSLVGILLVAGCSKVQTINGVEVTEEVSEEASSTMEETTVEQTEETTTEEVESTQESTEETPEENPRELATETTRSEIADYNKLSNETNAWWFKRNTEHQPSGAQDKIPIEKYDAYYVDKNTKEKVIYLTFDCGYENGFTPKILDVLKKKKVKAMFFVTKTFIRDNVDLVKRMKEEGHLVGNHTSTHPSLPSKSVEEIKKEIEDCASYCKEATGYEMDPYIRPPKGEYSERTLQVTKDLGYKTIFWSMAYLDYDVNNQPGKAYVVEHFKKYYHPGAIPLMHNVSQSNAEALEEIVDYLQNMGYSFESLDKMR